MIRARQLRVMSRAVEAACSCVPCADDADAMALQQRDCAKDDSQWACREFHRVVPEQHPPAEGRRVSG